MIATILKSAAAAAVSLVLAASAMAEVRIVDCDAIVQSKKRGVCANKLSPGDFKALAPGVSWFYNWHYKTDDLPPAGVEMEFIPMVWSDDAPRLNGLKSYLAAGNKPRAVLAINEPNLKGQAFITPQRTAESFKQIKAVADEYGIATVGPHMSLGSAPKDSITADDPTENKPLTYTFMVPFLKAFNHYLEPTKAEALAYHAYGNIHELRWSVGLMEKEFGRPVWVTEYAHWNTPNEAAAVKYLVQATDLLERTPNVHGYAWFKERARDNARISLLGKSDGELTALGRAYVSLPVHDAEIFYRIPGTLNAARYVSLSKMEIDVADAPDAFLMFAEADGGWCDYHLHVEKAGTYKVVIQAAGDGTMSIKQNDRELANVTSAGKAWQELAAEIELKAGSQTVRVVSAKKGVRIRSIGFARG